MAESPMVGARVPLDWQQQIQEIASAAGLKESEIVREAIAQYLGKIDPDSVKGALKSLQDRMVVIEKRLERLETTKHTSI